MTEISEPVPPNKILNYGLGVAAPFVALILNLLLWEWVAPNAMPFFLAAVALTAWRGGKLPGLFATAFSVLLIDYFFNAPLHSFELSLPNITSAVVFASVALFISWLDGRRRQALRLQLILLERERSARAWAENANREKDQFIAMVTHELRSPLNAIYGWSQMMRNGERSAAEYENAMNVIFRNSEKQKRLIEDLLDASRAAHGKLRIDTKLLEFLPIIESAVETVVPALEAKKIILETDLPENPLLIEGDETRLSQIVWNLLSNAAKFTPENGRIKISLSSQENKAKLEISDSGDGISDDFLPFVFESFRQADEPLTRKHDGLGLGLAIVRHLVEAHNGEIRATGKGEKGGATFTIELPLAAVEKPAPFSNKKIAADLSYGNRELNSRIKNQ